MFARRLTRCYSRAELLRWAAAPQAPPTDPAALMRRAGLEPDPWQQQFLQSSAVEVSIVCARQAGKSTATAFLILHTALYRPGSLVLLISPTLRQSGELFKDKVLKFYRQLGRPVAAVAENETTLALANGSRIVSLPSNEKGIVGFSAVDLLVIDEAARVADPVYSSVRPMLAVSRTLGSGRLVCLSTPYGKRGFFWQQWEPLEDRLWAEGEFSLATPERHYFRATTYACVRHTDEFRDSERRELGERWYRQEYECSFEAAVGAVFDAEQIRDALTADVAPLALSVEG